MPRISMRRLPGAAGVIYAGVVAFLIAVAFAFSAAAQDEIASPRPSLLSHAPADSWFVVFADADSNDDLPFASDVLSVLPSGGLSELVAALNEIAPGSQMFALTGLPAIPFSIGITLAFDTPLDQDALASALAERLAPAWNRSPAGRGLGEMTVDVETLTVHLNLLGKMPVVLAFAVRDGTAFASSMPGATAVWLDAVEPPASFIDTDDYARALQGLDVPPLGMMHANLRTLMPLAASALNGSLPGLGDGLSIGDVETVSLVHARTTSADDADPSESPVRHRAPSHRPVQTSRLRLAVGVSRIAPGPLRFLAPPPGESTLQRFYPRGTDFFIHGAMGSGTDFVEDVAAVAGAIDPAIVREYEVERADFRRETGLEPHAEFLVNFAGGWSLGGRVEADGIHHPLVAVGLRDGARFLTHMRTLQVAYRLEMTSNPYRGEVIHHALRKNGPFSYAVVDDVLLLSPEPQVIAKAIDAALDGRSLADDPRFEEVRRMVGGPTSRLVYVDAARIAGRILSAPRDGTNIDAKLAAVARTGDGVMLTTRPMDRMIAVEVHGAAKTVRAGADLLGASVVRSMTAARRQSQRIVSMSRLKQLATSCHVFANSRGGRWPASLNELASAGLLGDETAQQSLLEVPYPVEPDAAKRYLYKPPPKGADPATTPVVGEPAIHDGGACFGFADAHAEWIESPRAEELLAVLRSPQ